MNGPADMQQAFSMLRREVNATRRGDADTPARRQRQSRLEELRGRAVRPSPHGDADRFRRLLWDATCNLFEPSIPGFAPGRFRAGAECIALTGALPLFWPDSWRGGNAGHALTTAARVLTAFAEAGYPVDGRNDAVELLRRLARVHGRATARA